VTARISLILRKAGGHRPPPQQAAQFFCTASMSARDTFLVQSGPAGRRAFRKRTSQLLSLKYMKTLIVELDDETAARLEQVAPGRARRRSEFIRNAVRKALWEIEEQSTAQAYRRQPDSADDAYLNPAVWERRTKSRRTRTRARR